MTAERKMNYGIPTYYAAFSEVLSKWYVDFTVLLALCHTFYLGNTLHCERSHCSYS